MNILITGADGFLGKNLIEKLVCRDDINIMHYSLGTSDLLLDKNLRECDFLFHFAAVHRPKDTEEFYKVNDDFFERVLKTLEKYGNNCPVLLTSSIQANDSTDYGRSKIIAENMLKKHAEKTGAKAIIYRLYNVFGKWATPNLHSVVATFCHNINRDLPITVSNREIVIKFYYVDDVIAHFISQLDGVPKPDDDGIYRLDGSKVFDISLGYLADKFYDFRACQKKGVIPELNSDIDKKLYETYISYAD